MLGWLDGCPRNSRDWVFKVSKRDGFYLYGLPRSLQKLTLELHRC
jgi:hypothetical protein